MPRRSLPSLAIIVAAASCLSCSDAMFGGRGRAHIVFAPVFSAQDTEILRSLRSFNLGVTTLHVVVRRPATAEVLAENTVVVDENATEIQVTVDVPISGSQELLNAAVEMFSGEVPIFRGNVNVLARAGADPTAARPELLLAWVGPGAQATKVEITPDDQNLSAINGRLALLATAYDASGNLVTDPDFLRRFRWAIADTSLGDFVVTGELREFVAKGKGGIAVVSVLTPNLLRDTVRFNLQTVMPLSAVSFARKVEIVNRGATSSVPVAATDANGTPVTTAQYSYLSRNTEVATVSETGTITGVARGQTIVVVRAQEPGNETVAQDSLLAVIAEPGGPVVISSIDRFAYGRDAEVTVSVFVDMRSDTYRLGSTTIDVLWNPQQLAYRSWALGSSGVSPTVNATLTSTGQLTLAMADVTGFAGRVELLRITFRTSASASTGALTLRAGELSAADFTDLLSLTTQVSHPITIP